MSRNKSELQKCTNLISPYLRLLCVVYILLSRFQDYSSIVAFCCKVSLFTIKVIDIYTITSNDISHLSNDIRNKSYHDLAKHVHIPLLPPFVYIKLRYFSVSHQLTLLDHVLN